MAKDPLSVWLGSTKQQGDLDGPVVPLDIFTAASIGFCACISEAVEV